MECHEYKVLENPENDFYFYRCVECGEEIDCYEWFCYNCSKTLENCVWCDKRTILTLLELVYEKCRSILWRDTPITDLEYIPNKIEDSDELSRKFDSENENIDKCFEVKSWTTI